MPCKSDLVLLVQSYVKKFTLPNKIFKSFTKDFKNLFEVASELRYKCTKLLLIYPNILTFFCLNSC